METQRLEIVVVIHGLWMTGLETGLLRHRLTNEYGYDTELFTYSSIDAGLEENAERLSAFLATVEARVVHLVGHSLGGLLSLFTLDRHPIEAPGRVVCLGSPFRGSLAARGLARWDWGEAMLGRTARDGLLNGALEDYRGKRDVGVIAGTLGMGLGRLLADLPEPNDGTVAVEETRLPGATDHIELPVSHTGLILSPSVAEQVAYFLRNGRFRHEQISV